MRLPKGFWKGFRGLLWEASVFHSVPSEANTPQLNQVSGSGSMHIAYGRH